MVAAVALTGCSNGSRSDAQSKEVDGVGPKEVVLVTYDSFALPEAAVEEFKRETGVTIRVVESGDAAEMLTKALLSAGAPEGDVIFGIDTTLATRALSTDLLDRLPSATATMVPQRFQLSADAGGDRLVAIDHGDVCMNVDSQWFASNGRKMPETLEDLISPEYAGLSVVSSPVTSSPGLAFLVGTVARFGEDGWQGYWRSLKANDVLVRPSWTDAYYGDYTVSGGKRPIVLSYASSPPAEVVFSEGARSEPVSEVMADSCVSQVEYAGVLAGSKRPDLAAKLIEFMLGESWQKGLPLSNFVYPVTEVELPEEFRRWAPPVEDPLSLPADQISDNRDRWLEQWRRIME